MKIELSAVHKQFDTSLFYIDSCVFPKGRIHGIIGHNGVGKTTLLRMIAGLDYAYQGSIAYEGVGMDAIMQKKVSFITQKPYMLARSVADNIGYPLKLRKVDKEELQARTETWLKTLRIETLKKRRATVLSGGERQKVSLARGLIYNPKLLLLDEPTANIDPDSVEVIENVILSYQAKTQATVLMVTHDLSQALRVCDDLYILDNLGLHLISKDEIVSRITALRQSSRLLDLDYKALGV